MIWQNVDAGQVIGNTTAASTAADGSTKTDSTMDKTKEMFLQLLVAEMQYQDPLKPADNTEYVKELATFTQVETLNSVNDQVQQLQANSMVGKYVTVYDKETDTVREGKVDYVSNQNGTMFVSVNGELWDSEKVTSVQDPTYYEATARASSITQMIDNLPNPSRFTTPDITKVENLQEIISGLDDYTRGFISEDTMSKFQAALAKANEMKSFEQTPVITEPVLSA